MNKSSPLLPCRLGLKGWCNLPRGWYETIFIQHSKLGFYHKASLSRQVHTICLNNLCNLFESAQFSEKITPPSIKVAHNRLVFNQIAKSGMMIWVVNVAAASVMELAKEDTVLAQRISAWTTTAYTYAKCYVMYIKQCHRYGRCYRYAPSCLSPSRRGER